MSENQNVQKLIDFLKAERAESLAAFMALKQDGIPWYRQIHAWGGLAGEVVRDLHHAGLLYEGISGEEKHEAAVRFLNGLVDLPWVPEPLEAKVIGFAIKALWGFVKKSIPGA
jgi:hypothetical protein